MFYFICIKMCHEPNFIVLWTIFNGKDNNNQRNNHCWYQSRFMALTGPTKPWLILTFLFPTIPKKLYIIVKVNYPFWLTLICTTFDSCNVIKIHLFFMGFLSHFSSYIPQFMTSQESRVVQKWYILGFVKGIINFTNYIEWQYFG